jgi:hypothetical protein
MRDSRRYPAYPSDLGIVEAFRKLDAYLSICKFDEDKKSFCTNVHYRLKVSATRTIEADNYREFVDLLQRFPGSMPINMHGHFANPKKEKVACIVAIDKSGLDVTIESTDLNIISAFHERAKEFFQASNPLEGIERPVTKRDLKKTIFLAHRFDEYGNEVSGRLNTFLTRLGFQVLEGSGYEASDIPDKVMRKIRSQDIFICAVTPGDSSWILSEAAAAKALNKYVIITCQSGVDFNKGILGQDYEYIQFPDDLIEKTYSSLLYALPI